ncbi:MAG TPA: molybdopterin-dependent oxidoreductase [Dehalococcoidia bacterium]|nr:molybdopterin-dependent oxidoreductase [Dehalococcoidia bacterium]
MATKSQDVNPEFLQMKQPAASQAGPIVQTGEGTWLGWPTKTVEPASLTDKKGRVYRVRTPIMEIEGPLVPTELFYAVQHFKAPEPIPLDQWALTVDGEVKRPLRLSYDDLRRYPARTVRTVMECSGSDADFFEYARGERERPSRTKEGMILSAGEFTGAPLAAILEEAGLTGRAVSVRAEGVDRGVPSNDAEHPPFNYDKAVPIEKALHPDTILAWAQNGKILEHLHGAPARLLVPGWSGNWSVKWLRRLEVLDNPGNCYYHYNFYYYGESPDDPNKELVTTIGVKSIVTSPKDDSPTLPRGRHAIRGFAWSGAAEIAGVEVSVDDGQTWHAAHVEEPRERWMWVRWSYIWDAREAGTYRIMSRAIDQIGRVQPLVPRYNNMRKNFNAVVANEVTIM